MSLRLEPPADFPYDDVYARLLDLGASGSDMEVRQSLCALVLLLINQVGSADIVHEAIDYVQDIS